MRLTLSAAPFGTTSPPECSITLPIVKRMVLLLVLAIQAAVIGSTPALALDPAIYTTLPEFITGPTAFEVRLASPNATACAMTYGTETRTAAPWLFTFDPVERIGVVRIRTCEGAEFNYYMAPLPELAYLVSRSDESREAGHKSKMFIINNVELPGTVRITDVAGKVLTKATITANRSTPLSVILPKIAGRLGYVEVTVASDDGKYVVNDRIVVSRGWASVTSPLPIAPCSTVLWRYLPTGAAKASSRVKIEADIQRALKSVAAASGLTFEKTTDPSAVLAARASITFAWRGILANSGAQPQSTVTKDSLGARVTAQVWLNSLADSMSDRYAGSGRTGQITRAVLRILGLEETKEKGNLMFPSLIGPAGLGAGDRFGLGHLYQPLLCQP